MEPPTIPCWWGHDDEEPTHDELGAFKKKWGVMGIIPLALGAWLWKETGLQGRNNIDDSIVEIQIEILNCAQRCWRERGKTAMMQRPALP